MPGETFGSLILLYTKLLQCNICCSAGEELLWHYALHKGDRVRLADTLHDLSSSSTDFCSINASDSDDFSDLEDFSCMNDIQACAFDTASPSAPGEMYHASAAAPHAAAHPIHTKDSTAAAIDTASPSAPGEMHHASAAAPHAAAHPIHTKDSTAADTASPSATGEMHHASAAAPHAAAHPIHTKNSSAQRFDFDESEDDIGDSCLVMQSSGRPPITANVVGRIVGHRSRHVPIEDKEEVEGTNHVTNESAMLAIELSGSIESFDVAKMSASDIWHSILLKRSLYGGMLTRTLLNAASTDSACLPLWNLGTVQEKKVGQKKLQGIDFIQHFTPAHKLAWLRVKLFSIVSTNRNTYANMLVTFNGHTDLSLATAGNRSLHQDHQLRVGADSHFKAPEKKSVSSTSTASTRKAKNTDDSCALQHLTGNTVRSPSPASLLDDASNSLSNETPYAVTPQGSQATKRSIVLDEPEMDLKTYLTENKILKWWPHIYEKLGVTSIDDLKFLGKQEILQSLASLPSLPRLKIAAAVDS